MRGVTKGGREYYFRVKFIAREVQVFGGKGKPANENKLHFDMNQKASQYAHASIYDSTYEERIIIPPREYAAGVWERTKNW